MFGQCLLQLRGIAICFIYWRATEDKASRDYTKDVKHIWTTMASDWNFGHWRRSRILDFCGYGYQPSISSQNSEFSTKKPQLFRLWIGLEVLYVVIGYTLDRRLSSRKVATTVQRAIPSLVRLYTFLAGIMACPREDRSGNVGGHHRKLCNDMFCSFTPIMYNRVMRVIDSYI